MSLSTPRGCRTLLGVSSLDLSIVIPAHNEAAIIRETTVTVVDGLRKRPWTFEVIIVENGSSDDTAAQANTLAAEYPEVEARSRPHGDYGLALREGFLRARGAVVSNFDADFYDLDFLDRAVPLVIDPAGPVIVVGTKRGAGSQDHRAIVRKVVTRTFSTLLRIAFGLRVSDTHGVKAMRHDALIGLVDDCKFGKDLFDTELVLRAERAGLGTAELPVVVDEHRPPRESILHRIPRAVIGLIRMRIQFWKERI